ncbi:MAG TPA: hypothetical protein VKR06_27330 [Ktedonosporobacter sp.]|nr:hypothetical protein [Ktedonosporobacter sp.]
MRQVHRWLNAHGQKNDPVWITEWGSYQKNDKYSSLPMGITLINNLIRGSQPGDNYVYGSHIFSLYDYGTTPFGLISYNGTHKADYYAMRMAIRALQGCRPTYESKTNNPNLRPITTRDPNGCVFFLVTNQDRQKSSHINVDLSALVSSGQGTLWQFDADHHDQIAGSVVITNGRMNLTVPAQGALLVRHC